VYASHFSLFLQEETDKATANRRAKEKSTFFMTLGLEVSDVFANTVQK